MGFLVNAVMMQRIAPADSDVIDIVSIPFLPDIHLKKRGFICCSGFS